MPALKYWDGSAWQTLLGGGSGAVTPPSYGPVAVAAKDDGTINVNATAYGAFVGPSCVATPGGDGVVAIHFYAQCGLCVGGGNSDLVVTYSVIRLSDGVGAIEASDNNCLYLAPPPTPGQNGPGFLSGVMLATGLQPVPHTFYIHQRVSVGTSSMLRRRMVVMPMNLSVVAGL